MVTVQDRFAQLATVFSARTGVSVTAPRKRGLGSMALCVNEEIFAMLSLADQLVVRLPKERVDELVAASLGERFELGRSRPMQQWFVVANEMEEKWLPLAEEALLFTGNLAGH